MRLVNGRSARYILGLLISITPGPVLGLDWSGWVFDPTFSVRQEFNDNVGISFEGAGQKEKGARSTDAGFITTFSPGFLLRRYTERWQVDLVAGLAYNVYMGANVPDRDSERVELRSLFHLNERNTFQFATSYKRDTLIRSTFSDLIEPGEVIDEDIDIGLVGVSVRRNRINLVPSWQYALTKRTGIGLSYSFLSQSYTETEGVNLVGNQRHQLTGTVSYQFTPISALDFSVEASRRTSENDTQTDNVAFLIGIEHSFSELLTSEARVGYRITSTDINGSNKSSTGFVGQLAITYRTELGRLRGAIMRQVAPSGSGRSREVDRIRLQYSRSLLPRLSVALRVDAFRTQSVGDSSSGKRRYFDVEPRLSWQWTQWWAVQMGYHFRRRYEEDDSSSQAANSNGVFIAISYTPPPAVR